MTAVPDQPAARSGSLLAAAGLALLAFAASAWASGARGNPDQGNPVQGGQVYAANCGACHSLDANRVGPAHRGVVGRRAGTAPGYAYSPALRGAKFVWTERNLDRWLTNPSAMVPGTSMGFRLTDPRKRADVIAYLRAQAPTKRN
ncbi:MAG: c-type cytochrome [Novosphingobium sp.]